MEIDTHTFCGEVIYAHKRDSLRHYIKDEATLRMIEALCDVRLGEINTHKPILENGARLLHVRLKDRFCADRKVRSSPNPQTDPSDFAFYKSSYTYLPEEAVAPGFFVGEK